MECGADDGGGDFHGWADLCWAEDAIHCASEKEDLGGGIEGLVFGDVFDDVDVFSVCPTREDDEARLVVCV